MTRKMSRFWSKNDNFLICRAAQFPAISPCSTFAGRSLSVGVLTVSLSCDVFRFLAFGRKITRNNRRIEMRRTKWTSMQVKIFTQSFSGLALSVLEMVGWAISLPSLVTVGWQNTLVWDKHDCCCLSFPETWSLLWRRKVCLHIESLCKTWQAKPVVCAVCCLKVLEALKTSTIYSHSCGFYRVTSFCYPINGRTCLWSARYKSEIWMCGRHESLFAFGRCLLLWNTILTCKKLRANFERFHHDDYGFLIGRLN